MNKFYKIILIVFLTFSSQSLFSFSVLELENDVLEFSIAPVSIELEKVLDVGENDSVYQENISEGNSGNSIIEERVLFYIENDNKSYSLEIEQRNKGRFPFTINASFTEELYDAGLDTDSISELIELPLEDSFELSFFKEEFFIYENPLSDKQEIALNFSVTHNDEDSLVAGTYNTSVTIFLVQDNMTVDEKNIEISVVVIPYLKVFIVFRDVVNRSLDFGLIREDYKRIDRELEFYVASNSVKSFQLFQHVGRDMKSDVTQSEFYHKDVYFQIDESDKELVGDAYNEDPENIAKESKLIYISSEDTELQKIPLIYSLQNIGNFTVGEYEGELVFTLKGDVFSDAGYEIKIPYLVEIEKVFDFQIECEKNLSILDFNDGELVMPPFDRLVKVSVRSNTGKRYSFFHQLPEQLLNNEGGSINEDSFSYVLCNVEGELLDDEDFEQVDKNFQEVFSSDLKGTSADYFIRYRINYDKKQMAGSYNANLMFKLTDD